MNTRTPKVEENKSRSVANSVVQKKSNGKQGFGFVDNRLGARKDESVREPIQRKINISYQQYINTEETSMETIEAYYKNYVEADYKQLMSGQLKEIMGAEPEYAEMRDKSFLYHWLHDKWKTEGASIYVLPALEDMVAAINVLLDYAQNTLNLDDFKGEYDHNLKDSWDGVKPALKKMESLATGSEMDSQTSVNMTNAGHPEIPTIKWSDAKGQLPSSLRNLIRDIYTSWRIGEVFDKRDDEQKEARSKNANVEGGLRSWHVNEQNQLPDNSDRDLPGNAQDLQTHYEVASKHPYKSVANTNEGDKPSGYAEYTGTGIKDDWHNSKIVLDYKSGLVYLTVTHYSLWKNVDGEKVVGDKTSASGTQSAWFAFDMNDE